MTLRKILFACAALLALAACGKKEEAGTPEKSAASAQAAASPLDSEFTLEGAKPLDVDALFAFLPEDSRPTYDSAKFDEKLGATVVSNLRFHENGAETFTIARAEFYGVDLDAIERVKAAETASADAPFETIFQKIRIFDLTANDGDADNSKATIGAAEIGALRVRQGGLKGVDDNGLAWLLNGVNVGGLYFKNLAFTNNEPSAPEMSFSADDFRIVDVSGGKIAAIIGNGLDYEYAQTEDSKNALQSLLGPQAALVLQSPLKGMIAPDKQRTTIKSLEWRGLDFSGLVAHGLKGEKPPYTATDLLSLGDMSFTDMQTFIDDRLAASIEKSTISAKTFTWFVPTKITAATKGMVYDFSAYAPETEEATLEIIRKHGLDNVTGEASAEWTWDSDKGDAALNYSFDTEGFADFTLNLDLSGFEIAKIADAIEAGDDAAVADTASFKDFSMTLADEKLLEAIFDITAIQTGGSGADLRQSVPAMIRLSGAQAGELGPRFPAYVDAIANFVASGGTLKISAEPPKPVSIQSIATTGETAPQTLPDLLNLEITRKE